MTLTSLQTAIDNFKLTYGEEGYNDRLITLWANDVGKKFVTAEGNVIPKAQLVKINSQRGELPDDYYRVLQVWFTEELDEDKNKKVIGELECQNLEIKGTKVEYDKCGEKKVNYDFDLDIPDNEKYRVRDRLDAYASFIFRIGVFLQNFGKDTNSNSNAKPNFVYVNPDTNYEDILNYVIPCANPINDNKVKYRIQNEHIYINKTQGYAIILYLGYPMKDGLIMIPDNTFVYECINKYILYKQGELDFTKEKTANNLNYYRIMRADYTRYLLLAKKEIQMIDPQKFMAIWKETVHTILGRPLDYTPFGSYGK